MGEYFITQEQVTLKVDLTWLKFKIIQDLMLVLDTCKFGEVGIDTEGAMPQIRSNMGILALKGK